MHTTLQNRKCGYRSGKAATSLHGKKEREIKII